MRKLPLISSVSLGLAFWGAVSTVAEATDWLQFGIDEQHSSFNADEHGYSTRGNATLINGISIKTAGASPSTKSVDSAPVLATGLSIGGVTKDVLYFVAKDGTLIALDAATGTAIWSAAHTVLNSTTGSPVVDAGKQFVYAYALDGFVHKYEAATGAETTTGGWPVESTKKTSAEKAAASLSRVTTGGKTYLYSVLDGYFGDGNDYQGHVTAIDLSNASYKVFNANCSDLTYHFTNNGTTTGASPPDCARSKSGIWGRPGTVFDSVTGRLFITVANGRFDPTNSMGTGIDWGDSIIALNPDGTGSGNGMPVDSYTPVGADTMEGTDADLGSESIAILVPGKIGLQASKDACVRLINLANLSNAGSAGSGNKGGELAAYKFFTMGSNNCTSGSDAKNGGMETDELKPQPAVWKNPSDHSVWVFVSNYTRGLAAYQLDATNLAAPTLTQKWTALGGSSPVVANGTLYYIAENNNAYNVVAMDAVTGTNEWTSPAIGGMHWQSLIVANGRIYTADDSSHVWAFQLDGIFRGKFD